MLNGKSEGTLVIIVEIPEVSALLNEVHRLIVKNGLVFILCGFSAMKVKRKGCHRKEIQYWHMKGLKAFTDEYPECRHLYPLIYSAVPSTIQNACTSSTSSISYGAKVYIASKKQTFVNFIFVLTKVCVFLHR